MLGQRVAALRQALGWSQKKLAAKLGVSQPYVSMMELGERRLPQRLSSKLVSECRFSPTLLPLPNPLEWAVQRERDFATELGSLGYPGFAYLGVRRHRGNPAEVLLSALAQHELEPRVTEGLPWLLLRYWSLDAEWLVQTSRLHNLQNRLGLVVTMARRLSEGFKSVQRLRTLQALEAQLEQSRLAREDTLAEGTLSAFAAKMMRERRSPEAAHWNLLTLWHVEHLRYVE